MDFKIELLVFIIFIIILLFTTYLKPVELKYHDQKIKYKDPILNDILLENNFKRQDTTKLRYKLNNINNNDLDFVLAKLRNISVSSLNNKENNPEKNNLLHNENFSPTLLSLSNEDKVTSKYKLFDMFKSRIGLKQTLEIMPLTYNLLKKDDYKSLMEICKYDNKPSYILKSNNSGINYLYISNNNFDDIYSQLNNVNRFYTRQFSERICSNKELDDTRYTVAQKFITNQLLINGYSIKLRLYIMISKYMGATKGYIFRNGHIYYSNQKYNINNLTRFNSVATKEMMHRNRSVENVNNIYKNCPRSLLELKDKCAELNIDCNKLLDNLAHLGNIICKTSSLELGNSLVSVKNESFGLYTIDVVVDNDLNPYLIKMSNIKPLIEPITEREKNIRKNVWNDTLEKNNLIMDKDGKNGFKLIYE